MIAICEDKIGLNSSTVKIISIGVGTVVSGTLLRGMIKLNDTLMMGPDALGHFQPIAIKSIHRKR